MHRLETVQRAKLWRYLTGDPSFDVDWYLTRTERRAALALAATAAKPATALASAATATTAEPATAAVASAATR